MPFNKKDLQLNSLAKDAYDYGYRAFFDKKPRHLCPHQDIVLRRCWARGWKDAQDGFYPPSANPNPPSGA